MEKTDCHSRAGGCQGKWLGLNSMVDAANFLADKGWKLTQTYSSVHESKTILHWVFCKEADSPEEAIKGIMTRREYKKLMKNKETAH